MAGKTYAEMEAARKWVRMALKQGCDSPRKILEYIEQNANNIDSPSITTIGSIMRAEGYEPAGSYWERTKEKG